MKYSFENGYGASVISTPYSYGGDQGLFELAVLDEKGEIVYDTPITPNGDVLGWLTEEEVDEILERISQLPKKE